MKIYFLSDIDLPNYLEDSDFYSYMNYDDIKEHALRKKLFNYSFTGKYIHTNYAYWLCKNNGMDVHLIKNTKDVEKGALVFFHFDHKHLIYKKENIVLVQIIADRPIIPNIDFYTSSSKYFIKDNILYLPEPIPAKNLIVHEDNECTIPINFRFLGMRHKLPGFIDHKFIQDMKAKDISIKTGDSKAFIDKNDDVFFYLRDESENIFLKHGNRVKLSYLLRKPYIGNINRAEEECILTSTDIINISYNKNDLIDKMLYLKNPAIYKQYKINLSVHRDTILNEFLASIKNVISQIQLSL